MFLFVHIIGLVTPYLVQINLHNFWLRFSNFLIGFGFGIVTRMQPAFDTTRTGLVKDFLPSDFGGAYTASEGISGKVFTQTLMMSRETLFEHTTSKPGHRAGLISKRKRKR